MWEPEEEAPIRDSWIDLNCDPEKKLKKKKKVKEKGTLVSRDLLRTKMRIIHTAGPNLF